ncbi:MAG: glycine hydroxymethyltransferase, partial [Jiangellaceae bacterium]
MADTPSQPTAETSAFRNALDVIRGVEPRVADAIGAELTDQRASLKLIASENYASPAVLLAMGNWFSDKYAEGTIG